MKEILSKVTIFFVLFLQVGCANTRTNNHAEPLSIAEKIPVIFIKEGTQNPKVTERYINEIREQGTLIGAFSEKSSDPSFRKIKILLPPGDHEIQFSQSGITIETITINPIYISEVRYNPSKYDVFMEEGVKYLTLPIFLVTWPIWGTMMVLDKDK